MESRQNELSTVELDNLKANINIDTNKKPIEMIDEVSTYIKEQVYAPIKRMQGGTMDELEHMGKCKGEVNKLSDSYISLELATGEKLKELMNKFYEFESDTDFQKIFLKLDKLNQAKGLLSEFLSDCENTRNAYVLAKSTVNNLNKRKLTTLPFLFVKNPKQGIKVIKNVHYLYKNRAKDKKEVINHSESITEVIDQLKEIMNPQQPHVEQHNYAVTRNRSKTF